ncbi:hypothetical protein [Streptacidiphilus sp. MAP5-52]
MIPTPVEGQAKGDLTPDEADALGTCERAVENLGTATWLAGKALQTIRDGKLYRQTHPRFEDYITERWEIGERTAYQMIEEWPLAERLNTALGKPATASHTRALLPVATQFGLDQAVTLYQELRTRAQDESVRLTASLIGQIVKAIRRAVGKQSEEVHFQEAARQVLAVPALPLAIGTGTKPAPTQQQADPTRQSIGSDENLRNFAKDHRTVTVVPSPPPATEQAEPSTVRESSVNSHVITAAPTTNPASPAPPAVPSTGVERAIRTGPFAVDAGAQLAVSAPDAVFVLEDILRRVVAIQRDLTTPVRTPDSPAEQHRIDALVDEIVQRLRDSADSLTDPEP